MSIHALVNATLMSSTKKAYTVIVTINSPDGAKSTFTRTIDVAVGFDLCDIHNLISHYLQEVIDIKTKTLAERESVSDSEEEDEKEECHQEE